MFPSPAIFAERCGGFFAGESGYVLDRVEVRVQSREFRLATLEPDPRSVAPHVELPKSNNDGPSHLLDRLQVPNPVTDPNQVPSGYKPDPWWIRLWGVVGGDAAGTIFLDFPLFMVSPQLTNPTLTYCQTHECSI
jgi:hypothetical protein